MSPELHSRQQVRSINSNWMLSQRARIVGISTEFSSASKPCSDTFASSCDHRVTLSRNNRKRPSRAKKRLGDAQNGLGWSDEEHERFLHGLEIYPTGPWKDVAAFVGTRTTRQVMTHAQKYRQKIARRQRGLQTPVRKRSTTTSSVAPTGGETAAATCTRAKPAQDEIKSEEADFAMELGAAATSVELGTCTNTSPSSTDHTMDDFTFYSSNAVDFDGLPESSSYSVAMTTDEFRLVTDELYAETLWVNQFDNDQMSALMMQHDVEDPLALMFQDPGSLLWSQNKNTPMDVVYPAHVSMELANVHVPYECQL